ncbi:hypothetical protein [Stutzerimonas nitrititolerans]|uniref:hypothetical protein n=1 Tax=Stutzerimonas nitrititolerans TaxID=2482751 RepID=UPI0028A80B98|nr:hypothetical protein [Stutzerimonas nitrititolerans]
MIALLIGLILTASLAGLAFIARYHPIPAIRRWLQVGCAVAAVTVLVTSLLLYPAVNVWQQYQAGQAAASKHDLERIRAEHMIAVFGSPQAYIEYLKAIRSE